MASPAKNNKSEQESLTQKIENNLKPLENILMSKSHTESPAAVEAKSPYSVNKTLFEAATKIKNHLELIHKRLEKMEEHRSQVSESVYLKVKTDYEAQLDEVNSQFEGKCSEVESELRQLYQAKSKQELELAKHQEILEEARFRHTLGEYTDRQFKEIDSKENKAIGEFNKLLEIIQGSIQQYENIIGHPYSLPEGIQQTGLQASPQIPTRDAEPVQEAKMDLSDIENLDTEYTPALGSIPARQSATSPEEKPLEAKALPSEDSLEAELDDLLESEGSADDYFEKESAKPETPSLQGGETKVAPSPASQPAKEKSEDPSISSLLRDIPLEPEAAETKVASPVAEATQKASPAQASIPEASLLLIEGELDEPEINLGESLSIGRSPSNDLVLKESKISRQHASIHYREGAFWLVDLKSSNGVYVNDQRLEEAALKDGDEIKIGSFKFQFSLL